MDELTKDSKPLSDNLIRNDHEIYLKKAIFMVRF